MRQWSLDRPIHFFGCDIGGWHTKRKDGLALCQWRDGTISNQIVASGRLFYPLGRDSALASGIRDAINQGSVVVVSVDAALAWPIQFLELATTAGQASHVPRFDPNDGQMNNPYLFRETERFIKRYVRRDREPYSAPGQSFGNPCSKAQALVAALKAEFPNSYRPPFDTWSQTTALESQVIIIEVYPAASMASDQFAHLRWAFEEPIFKDLDYSDENDAKRCCVTAICFAMTSGLIPQVELYPAIWLPDEIETKEFHRERFSREGWIFAPKRTKV